MIKSEGRVLARTALVFTVFMSLLYLVLSGNAGGFGTAGAQVSPTSGYSIQWVNPDTDSNSEVSAQNKQGVNNSNSYHLVAWVNRLPADAFVEFCVDDCNPSSERITPENAGADFVSPDTFEHFWSTLPAEGAYTLRARLFSGGTLLAEDTVSVTVNNAVESPAPPNSVSEGVEITDPANGEELGFYRPPDTTLYTAVLDVAASAGTTVIEAKYTISAPGTEPIWKRCGIEGTDDAQGDGLRCELEEGASAEDVTAVAAVAYDDPTAGEAPDDLQAQFREGGDGHRIDGYTQVPEALALDFVAADGAAQGDAASTNPATCSPLLRATVIDQNGESVPQVNVDFHARGPDDDIRFVQVADNAMKAPDLGGHTATDPASNCTGGNTGTQGEHDSPADDDTKHVESMNNTNDAGQFTVQLYHANSGEVPGTTQINAWADLDGNDQFCSREPSDNAAIGWGQGATASGVPSETSSCILPGATPTSTPSATPSASSTGSATPTTTTTTTTPSPTRKRIASTATIKFRNGTFKGIVRSSNKKCRTGRLVKVKKQRRGRDATVGRDRTNRSGAWSERERRARGRYYAVAAKKRFTQRNGTIVICRSDKSPTIRVRRR